MASEDGAVKIKVDMDISDVGAGVKDIGEQLKKAGDAAAQAGKSMGKNLSRSSWGYDKGAVEFMENFGKAMEKDAKAASDVMKYYHQQGVEAESAAKSVRKLAEEEAKDAAKVGEVLDDDGTADTIGRQVQSAEKALAEMSAQGLGAGDAKWDEAYQTLVQLKKEEKAYLADLAKTPEEREREAAAAAKTAARAEELRQKEEARTEAVRKREEAEAAEAQRLTDIARQATVGNQTIIDLTKELERLQARNKDLEAAGVGAGYVEHDANAARIRAIIPALREYAATGSDVTAQTLVQTTEQATAWGRLKQHLIGAAMSMGLVRKQTGDTSTAMATLRTSAGTAAAGMGNMFKKVLKWGLGIRSTFILVRKLRNAVKEGLSIMAQHDTETANTLNSLKTALTNVKLSLATAFAPVVTAVAPLLIKLSDLVSRAANAVARFFAMLTGKSTYKKAVAAQDAITESVAGTGAAAKEAAKNLSGLDELNIWQENKGGSGGGGGSGSGPDVDLEEVETGEATDFVVRLRDILFQWDDLDPELIAEKILTGLCAAAGGIIGWTLGGPLGGLVGLTLGALLGVKLSQVTFDGDGTLNKEEIAKLIITAIMGLFGGIVGVMAGGGVAGAAIGFSIGTAVSFLINKTLFNSDGKIDNVEGLVLTAVLGLLGGALGMVIGGPLGAAIGFTVGAAVSVALSGAVLEKGKELIGWVKENIFGPIGDAVKAVGALAVTVVVGLVKKVGEWAGEAWDLIKDGAQTIKHKVTTALSKAKDWVSDAWDAVKDGAKTVKHKVTTAIEKAKDWASDAWDAVKDGAKTVAHKVTTALSHAGAWAADAWDAVKGGAKTVAHKVTTALSHAGAWAADAWDAVKDGAKTVAHKVTTALSHAGAWAADAWDAVKGGAKTVAHKVTTALSHAGAWAADAWDAVKNGARTVAHKVTTALSHAGTWKADAWDAVKGGAKTIKHTVTTALKQAGTWASKAWTALTSKTKTVTVSTAVKKAGTWVANAWSALTKVSKTVTVSTAVKKAGTWVDDAWTAISSGVKKTITVTVSLLKSGWSAFKDWLGLSTGGIYVNGQWQRIEGYASGGSPRRARLFYANENGMPELVGRIGSNTAVMNNGQIVASVAAGVYQAVAAAMGQVGGWFRAMSAQLADIPPAIEMLANMPAQVPQPVMAAGTVLPPKAVYADGPVRGLADAVEGLRSELARQSGGRSGTQREPVYNVNLNVDGRTLLQVILSQGRLRQLQSGGNPFMELMGG